MPKSFYLRFIKIHMGITEKRRGSLLYFGYVVRRYLINVIVEPVYIEQIRR